MDVFAHVATFSSSGTARLSTWILTIASHRAIDIVRRRGVEQRLLSNAVARDKVGRHAIGVHRQPTPDIDAALRDLSAEHRAIFILCDVYEFTYAEVSVGLKIEIGTVKSRLARARAAARIALAEQAEPDIAELPTAATNRRPA
jgi:RNA polymerase sigma-70 factor, ECF subfamily